MRVAYIGNFLPEYSTENDVRKAFESLGHEVVQLQENKMNIRHLRNMALTSDMLLITSTWDTIIPLTDMLTLFKELAERKIPTATLHLDTFWGKSRGGRKWWLNPMFHTAYIFTADGDYQEEWKAYGKNHIWLPPAIRHDAVGKGNVREEYKCDVAFVGSNGVGYHEDVWPDRKALVDHLRAMCQNNGWTFKNPGGDDAKVERSTDLNDFYASASVVVGDSLCLLRKDSHYWSDRVPETTGRGGLLIMPEIDAIKKIYGSSVPMYEWGNYLALEKLITGYLATPELVNEAKNESLNITRKGHTYVNRVETILETVGLK